MSTQQDIYAAGSKNRPPMLNKENYVPWSSRLLRYAKSRPNGKLIHNSIINGPYVRRIIPEPGDPNREVSVNETFHVQTDDELTEKELKQLEADDQAIQTILLGLPEDIYAVVDSCETAQEIWLRNLNGYNDVQNVKNQVIQNAAQNLRVQNVGNQNGLIGVPGNANHNPNGNGNLLVVRTEGNANGHNGNKIRCYNCRGVGHFDRNCTVISRRSVRYWISLHKHGRLGWFTNLEREITRPGLSIPLRPNLGVLQLNLEIYPCMPCDMVPGGSDPFEVRVCAGFAACACAASHIPLATIASVAEASASRPIESLFIP
nr:integrase, catalytic region, zinc finger, CCHC-type, peptidase aspartic, catalytic [Tanacetum cinerariifolium]